LKAFGELYVLGTQIKCECDNPSVYTLAATNGKRGAILISNPTDNDVPLELDFAGEIYECKVIAESRCLSPMGYSKPKVIEAGTVLVVTVDI
jgi:hypothetical protein